MSGGLMRSVFCPSLVMSADHRQWNRAAARGRTLARLGGNRHRRQFAFAAAPAHGKDAVLDELLAHRDVALAIPDFLKRRCRQITNLDTDERAEVDLARKGNARVEEGIEAASFQLRAGRVVVVHQLRMDLRTEIEQDVVRAALFLELRYFRSYSRDVQAVVGRHESFFLNGTATTENAHGLRDFLRRAEHQMV